MKIITKSGYQVRREAVRMVRDWARDRDLCGDPEGAGEFRDLANAIAKIILILPEALPPPKQP
jgi:hypothetical protein